MRMSPQSSRDLTSPSHRSPERMSTPPARTSQIQTTLGDDTRPARLGTAGSEGRSPSRGHHFTLTVRENDQGGPEMFFMDSRGGREMTLIAKKPIPTTWAVDLESGGKDLRRNQSAKKYARKSSARSFSVAGASPVDQSSLFGIAQKVQARLASELEEAKIILSKEQVRSAELAAQLEPPQMRRFLSTTVPASPDQLCTPLKAGHSPMRTPDHRTPASHAGSGQSTATVRLSPLLNTTASAMSVKVHASQPNPNRYRSPPRADARSTFAKGRGLDPITGVSRTATWRLQNQWRLGLNCREIADGNSYMPNDQSELLDKDIDGRIAAEQLLRERLAELDILSTQDEAMKQLADGECTTPYQPNFRPGTGTSRKSNISEADVAGVRLAQLQAYQECFDTIIGRFHLYAPLLSRVKREFDDLISAFEVAMEALPVMVYMLMVIALFFAALVFVIEPDDSFRSFFDPVYLSMITMNT